MQELARETVGEKATEEEKKTKKIFKQRRPDGNSRQGGFKKPGQGGAKNPRQGGGKKPGQDRPQKQGQGKPFKKPFNHKPK